MMQAQMLAGTERDEVVAMVERLQQAGSRQTTVFGSVVNLPAPQPTGSDLQWASDMQLPREFFDYFELDHAA